jgi:DNA-binding winged helix-turn-helix (wHTH) protein
MASDANNVVDLQSWAARRHASPCCFGPFELHPDRRLLLRHGRPVPLGGRAFDLLVTLASRPGTILSRQALMDAVWPTTTVEECNLRFQMSCLRRALGPEGSLIKTIAGRGYMLSATVSDASPTAGRINPAGLNAVGSEPGPFVSSDRGAAIPEDDPLREIPSLTARLADCLMRAGREPSRAPLSTLLDERTRGAFRSVRHERVGDAAPVCRGGVAIIVIPLRDG